MEMRVEERTGQRRPAEPDADDPSNWNLHLHQPTEEQDVRMLGGCSMHLPSPGVRSLWQALMLCDSDRVAMLLDDGGDINQHGGPYHCTPLGWAAFAGDAALVQLCVSRGAKLDACTPKGSTPLHMSVWNGDNEEVVRLLLQAGADTTTVNQAGLTPLAQARTLHELEAADGAMTRYHVDSWRSTWSRHSAGRSKVIALLKEAGNGTQRTGLADSSGQSVTKGGTDSASDRDAVMEESHGSTA